MFCTQMQGMRKISMKAGLSELWETGKYFGCGILFSRKVSIAFLFDQYCSLAVIDEESLGILSFQLYLNYELK